MNGKVFVSSRVNLSTAHRLHNPVLSDEKNKAIFGKCNNFHGHGHNYSVKVTVCGYPDDTGMVINFLELDNAIKRKVYDVLDHKFLDKDVEHFKSNMSTAENIAIFIWNQLKPGLKGFELVEVKVKETGKYSAVYRGY